MTTYVYTTLTKYSSTFKTMYIALASISEVQVHGNPSCACSGEVLTFVCTTVGPGQTIWRGTAFNCTGESNEIILRHSEFDSPTGISGTCNSGAIVGQSLGVENADCYTSQLSITIQSQFNNTTVEYVYSYNNESIIGQLRLSVVSGEKLKQFVELYHSNQSIH